MSEDWIFTHEITKTELNAYIEQEIEQYCKHQAKLRKQRQTEGIAVAKARGVRFGRPRIDPPSNFGEIIESWEEKSLSLEAALQMCNMSKTTFFRRVKQYRLECGINSKH